MHILSARGVGFYWFLFLSLTLVLSIFATSSLRAESRDIVWKPCAAEDGTCNFHGTAQVSYGAKNKWVTKKLRGPVHCSNRVFGDPLPRHSKSCYVETMVSFPSGSPRQLTFTRGMRRNGNFAKRVKTPQCDGFDDTIKKYGGRAFNAVTLLNPYRHVAEFALSGFNPERYLDKVKRDYKESKTFIGDAVQFAVANNPVGVLALAHYISKVLPDGKVTNFMARGRSQAASLARSLAVGTLDSVEKDLSEITADTWKVLKNIDNPERFVNEFGGMFQKWTPIGAVSLIFTTGDPEMGLKLAAQNLLRQAEIAETYLLKTGRSGQIMRKLKHLKALKNAKKLRTANAIATANKLKGLDMARSSATEVVKGLVESQVKERVLDIGKKLVQQAKRQDKKAMALLVKSLITEMDAGGKPSGIHRLFKHTEVRQVPAVWLGDDLNTGASHDMSHWHPRVEDGSDCISLGDYIHPKNGVQIKTLPALCGKVKGSRAVASGQQIEGRPRPRAWWSRPVDYAPLWNDSCSGGKHHRSIWVPVCRKGYAAVGVVLAKEGSTKPLPNRIACLKMDPSILSMSNGQTAGLKWTTNDRNSGSKTDVTVYNRNFHGMFLSWAVTGYPGENDAGFLNALEVPVARTHPVIVRQQNTLAATFAREQEKKRQCDRGIGPAGSGCAEKYKKRKDRYKAIDREAQKKKMAAIRRCNKDGIGPASWNCAEKAKANRAFKDSKNAQANALQFVNLVARHSGKCLEIFNGDKRENVAVTHRQCDGSNQQRFTLNRARELIGGRSVPSNSNFNIITSHTGRCFGGPTGNGNRDAQIRQYRCNGTDHLKFFFRAKDRRQNYRTEPGRYYEILQQNGKCMDISDGVSDNIPVKQLLCDGSNKQAFLIKKAPLRQAASISPASPATQKPSTGINSNANAKPAAVVKKHMFLIARHSGKCLDVRNGETGDNVPLNQRQCNGSNQQQFVLNNVGGGAYNIVARHSGKCLNISNGDKRDNIRVNQYSCNGSSEQKFRLRSAGGKYLKLISRHTGKCINIYNGDNRDNAAVVQFLCDGSNQQAFLVKRASAGQANATQTKPSGTTNQSNLNRINKQMTQRLVGNYVHKPTQNNWHVGSIVQDKNGRLWWANKAGVNWRLHLDPTKTQSVATGTDNPYYAKYPSAREFKLLWENGRLTGFNFGNSVYVKQ